MMCKICDSDSNDFVPLNDTVEYSEIEIAINRQGMLRARYYPSDGSGNFYAQDVVNIDFCPICGRRF